MSLVVEAPAGTQQNRVPRPSDDLVGWIMAFVPQWRKVRDGAYKAEWDDAYRTWRGKWSPEMKNRKTERSKLISPATAMAIDLAVAEMVEAIFGRDNWFDFPDDFDDQQKEDMRVIRERLKQDLYRDGIIEFLVEVLTMAAIYGTGAAKVVVDTEMVAEPKIIKDDKGQRVIKVMVEKARVYPVAIEPGQLVVDPAAAKIPNMLGAAHEYPMPMHKVRRYQQLGYYDPVALGVGVSTEGVDESTGERKEEDKTTASDFFVNITEYHGLVPERLLTRANAGDDEIASALSPTDNVKMVEAVVTIANESELLRARANPSVLDDRAIHAYQHETVPNRFWGRGVSEKGRHPQKAIEAEMRARMDSLAWVNNPMMAIDTTAMGGSRMNFDVWPGKVWALNGRPGDVLQEFRFGDINGSTFQHVADLERMHQQATGAMDSPARLTPGVRDQSSTASAVNASGMIKRSKRAMYNVEAFLQKLLRAIVVRKMQFEPDRYPVDINFQVKGALGMMAREVEQGLMTNMLQFVEAGTPEQLLVLKGIMETSSSPNRDQLIKLIDEKMKPPPPEEQQMMKLAKQLPIMLQQAELQKTRAQTALFLAQGDKAQAEALLKNVEADFKDDELIIENMRLLLDQSEVDNTKRQNELTERKLDIEEKKVTNQARQATQKG